MYIENKYFRWYFSIIGSASARGMINGYHEKHHIVPKSLGGPNTKDNLVALTAREHFICHVLLTKFTEGEAKKKMLFACQGMNRSRAYQDRYINARLYDVIKQECAKVQSERMSGKTLTAEHKEKISIGGRGRKDSTETIQKRADSRRGKLASEESRKKMSLRQKELAALISPEKMDERMTNMRAALVESGKNKEPKSMEHKQKISESLKGKMKGIPKSEETKQKMRKPKSEAHKKAISEARKAKYAAVRNEQP